MKQKISQILSQLNQGLVEREDTLKIALLTVLAGEHLVLIGPPGTGKSLIARRIADSIAADASEANSHAYFEYLLTKFSTPEEIFGPLSIAALKRDHYQRNTEAYLPTVRLAFLDEIFKASSSILNALLTILNERLYHNGAKPQTVPLQALIAASNELPTEQQELLALYDRFLVRKFVDYVSPGKLGGLFEKTGAITIQDKLSIADLAQISQAADAVTIPAYIQELILKIWAKHKETFKEDRREHLSDRRFKKVVRLLRVSAASNMRTEMDFSDVFILRNCLWNHVDNARQVSELISDMIMTFSQRIPLAAAAVSAVADNAVNGNELAEDGKTAMKNQTSSLTKRPGEQQVVKGFQGRGTEHDPLLVQTLEELMDLGRAEVGMQGYYFRQMADIDCNSLTTWSDMSFKGHYDGNGFMIKFRESHSGITGNFVFIFPYEFENDNSRSCLFKEVLEDSSITNLRLDNFPLTQRANKSQISHCISNTCLIENFISKCEITSCLAHDTLVKSKAYESQIRDSLVLINWDICTSTDFNKRGGIATQLKNSVVERCFVQAKITNAGGGNVFFSAIADDSVRSQIRQCAVGTVELKGSNVKLPYRIVKTSDEASQFETNASIDSNAGTDNFNGKDGKTVAAALFKERFFVNTLGWDFEHVWQWDDKEERPALRAASDRHAHARSAADNIDLLTRQVKANIWL